MDMPIIAVIAVIGGGPAGLRAAEVAAARGAKVMLFDAKPSVGRKFLVAGKGGLNLTHGESIERFVTRYRGPQMPNDLWLDLLKDFSPQSLRQWAAGLGVETFEATSGRVYPKALKAAPMLRAWIVRLKAAGVLFHMNHEWQDMRGDAHGYHLRFRNEATFHVQGVVFALGGGSWPMTGSNGAWMPQFKKLGLSCSPLVPANCGWETPWSEDFKSSCEGKPLKNIKVAAGEMQVHGELMFTRYGLEGGAIYQLAHLLRDMPQPEIEIDLKPTFEVEALERKMESVKRDFLNAARVRWRLCDVGYALLARREYNSVTELALEAKKLVVKLIQPRPIEEVISSAGGLCWSEVNRDLMIKRLPGVFVAGEMLDWEAPTGGYLLQGSFATGSRAGQSVVKWLNEQGL